jgi:hypothetical protein
MPYPPILATLWVRASRYRSNTTAALRPRCDARNWLFPFAMIAALGIGPLGVSQTSGITIEWDYQYDTNGFFSKSSADGLAARAALEFAGQAFEPFMDQLDAIISGGSNQWTATFKHPGTGVSGFGENNPVIRNETILIFAGGRDLPSSQVGLGGPGGFTATGSTAFLNTIQSRGQESTTTDFGPWGGSISFDTYTSNGTPRDWHYDVSSAPSIGQTDLLSIALHELGHLFGFGISTSFNRHLAGSTFQGNAVTDLYGGSAPMWTDLDHWDLNTTSPPYTEGSQPQAAMGPSIILGTRKVFTPLDYASLKDTGWEVPDMLLGLPGDSDGDQDVDGTDFLQWQHSLGLTGALPTDGDFDGDGDVDEYDGWILSNNMGATGALSSLEQLRPVPEPAMGLMLALATAWIASGSRGNRFNLTIVPCRERLKGKP